MNDYSILEKQVFNALLDIVYSGYGASVKDLADKTNLEVPTIKGVIGSLVKKNKVQCEGRKISRIDDSLTNFNEAFPIVNGEPVSFGCDIYSLNKYKEFYLK